MTGIRKPRTMYRSAIVSNAPCLRWLRGKHVSRINGRLIFYRVLSKDPNAHFRPIAAILGIWRARRLVVFPTVADNKFIEFFRKLHKGSVTSAFNNREFCFYVGC